MSEKLEKEIEGWGVEREDFVVDKEITVTITLHEYRDLVKLKAIKDFEIEKIKSKNYSLEEENKKLKQRILEIATYDESEEDTNE